MRSRINHCTARFLDSGPERVAQEPEEVMQDDNDKPAATDAQPKAGSTKLEQAEQPGKAPKLSETDAQPDAPSTTPDKGGT